MAGSSGGSIFSFLRALHALSSTVVVLIYLPTNSVGGFPLGDKVLPLIHPLHFPEPPNSTAYSGGGEKSLWSSSSQEHVRSPLGQIFFLTHWGYFNIITSSPAREIEWGP